LVLATAGAANAAPARPSASSSSATANERAEAQAVAAAERRSNPGSSTALAVYEPGVAAFSLLPFGQRTDTSRLSWNTAAGWLTGDGWCTVQFRKNSGSPDIVRQLPDLGSGPHYIGKDTTYFVYPYRSTDPNCPSTSANHP
jgi:hypothetical protein